MRIVVTGGAGFIGSHTVVLLLETGHDVMIIDNFINAAADVPDRIARLVGKNASVVCCDLSEPENYRDAMSDFGPEAVIHFAGLKAVADSVSDPLEYYRVNVGGSLALFREMTFLGCNRLVFSSSATVYGSPRSVPVSEDHPCRPTNPYGRSKRMVEELVEDWGRANPALSAVNLRYFNPVGAHPSAKIGEAPKDTPNNLMPYVAQVADGTRQALSVFGDDYDTLDGTGVRDYIHVMDVADAHLSALDLTTTSSGVRALNIGTGKGYSVFDVIRAFEHVTGKKIPFDIKGRRPGDVAMSLADPSAAAACMGWRAKRDLKEMCHDMWAWQCESKQ